jgi:hypothetical protein
MHSKRYLTYFGPADGGSAAAMFEDLADLFEQAAADGTPVRAIVGEDPVEFAEAFLRTTRGVSGSSGSVNGSPTPSIASRATNRNDRERISRDSEPFERFQSCRSHGRLCCGRTC